MACEGWGGLLDAERVLLILGVTRLKKSARRRLAIFLLS